MLTAENADRKITRNSSYFKKLLAEHPTSRTNLAFEGETVDLDAESSPPSPPSRIPVSVQEAINSPVDPGGRAEILTEPVLRRSACVSMPPRRLIQEM